MSPPADLSTAASATVWAVVPAAGNGSRFGASKPKQYLSLQGQPIAQRSLQTLQQSDLFSAIIVAVNPTDRYFDELPIVNQSAIERVAGGDSRAESVLNGLRALSGRARPNDWVMVHDIARPLVSVESLQRLLAEVVNRASSIDGAVLATPVYDTVKQVSLNTADNYSRVTAPLIEQTLDRNQLWAAQTPQLFRYQQLLAALGDAIAAGHSVTDEASAMEWVGARVTVVSNTARNIKITTADDLQLAEFYLADDSSK